MKTALIIATVFVVVGLVMSVVCFAVMGFDFKELNMMKPVTNDHTVKEEFSSIEITAVEAELRIILSDEEFCRVVCNEDENRPHTVTVENGVLKIERQEKLPLLKRLLRLSWGKQDITLYLPKKEYASLRAQTVSGNISVDPDFVFMGDFDAKTVSGNITVPRLNCKSFSAETVSGNITVTTLNCASFDAETVSGESRFSSVCCTGEFEASSVSGNIKLDRCDATTLDLEAVSGNVSGTLLSPKSFVTDTTSGKVTVPKDSAGGRCKIETTSGNISFSIEE